MLLGSNRDEFGLFSQMLPLHRYKKFSIDALLQPLGFDVLLDFFVPNPFLHSTINSLYDPNGDYEYPVNWALVSEPGKVKIAFLLRSQPELCGRSDSFMFGLLFSVGRTWRRQSIKKVPGKIGKRRVVDAKNRGWTFQ